MSGELLLTFNAGSSTVKIGLFEIRADRPQRIASGMIDFRASPLTFRLTHGSRKVTVPLKSSAEAWDTVIAETFEELGRDIDMTRLSATCHRVVHGGDSFARAIRLDDASMDALAALTPLAPLHQPQNLHLIRAIRQLRPELAQTASFDTAFHRTNNDIVRRFALPRELHDKGVKRYGFHGLSYKYIAGELARLAPELAEGKTVAAHLGSGASLCAMDGGVSRDTSMGFSTLDGVPMATRCGALDPGVLLHLLGQAGLPLADLEDMLYHRSGLLGLSGISADSRQLLQSDAPEAKQAIDVFTLRIAGEIARLAATLGGLDAIVFTAGIGENQPPVRAGVCARLQWLGIALDETANAANALKISRNDSRIDIFVIPTDEEQVIADEGWSALAKS